METAHRSMANRCFAFVKVGRQITAETYQNEDCSGSPVAHYTMNSGKCYVQGSQSSIVFCPSRGAATSSPTPTKHHHEGPPPTPIPAPRDNEDFEAYTCTDTTCSNCTLVKKSPEAVVNGDCISMNGKSAKRLCRDGKHITVDSFDTEDCSGSPIAHVSATAGKCLVGDSGQQWSSIVFCPASAADNGLTPSATTTQPTKDEPHKKNEEGHPFLVAFSVLVLIASLAIAGFFIIRKKRTRNAFAHTQEYEFTDDDDDLIVERGAQYGSKKMTNNETNEDTTVKLAGCVTNGNDSTMPGLDS